MKKLLILGAGGYGKTVADLAAQLGGYDSVAFLDDGRTGEGILGKCGDYLGFHDGETEMYPAFGANEIRLAWLNRLLEAGIPVPSLIHPRAYVSSDANLGTGSVVLPMAVVNVGVTVEKGCIVNIGVLIDHDCVIGEGTHLAPGVIVKAENRIPAGMKIESGTVIQNRSYPL